MKNDAAGDCARNSLHYGARVKAALFLLALGLADVAALAAETPTSPAELAAATRALEQRVSEIVQAPKITVVHFWAPWCPNCREELVHEGWKKTITANPNVEFVFVTSWNDGLGDGRAILEKYGIGPQKNFQVFLHPNGSRKDEDKMNQFLGFPVTWLPATWIFRSGKQRFAFNYGEVRFSILQQLIDDSERGKWDR